MNRGQEPAPLTGLHVMCERDVGLFSLIQQVVANVPWALAENRAPVALFRDRCCYFTPSGYAGADNVWEYYFEPVSIAHPTSVIEPDVLESIDKQFPQWDELGRHHGDAFITAHFGDHPKLSGKALSIPYLWDDPDPAFRQITADIVRRYVRPRDYILDRVERFWNEQLEGSYAVGVHVRGTDAVSWYERRAHRLGSLSWKQYIRALKDLVRRQGDCRIFLATDTRKAVDVLRGEFGDRVVTCNALRHEGGDSAGFGPDGGLLPAYIASDRDSAARNGEEAVIDYLLLCRCNLLVHNSSGLARSVLMANADIPHINTHLERKRLVGILRGTQKWIHRYRRWRGETEPFRISEA